jgi:hypothetical protein
MVLDYNLLKLGLIKKEQKLCAYSMLVSHAYTW